MNRSAGGGGKAGPAASTDDGATPSAVDPAAVEVVPAAATPAAESEAECAEAGEQEVVEPTKLGADKVLTPPSEPAVPSADSSADAAAIEAAILAASDALEPLSERLREARQNPFKDKSRAHDCQTIEEIAQSCRKAGREWKDPSFGHADEEIFKNWPAGLDKKDVSWEPPSRYCSTRRPVGKTKDGKRTWLYCDFNGDGALRRAAPRPSPRPNYARAAHENGTKRPLCARSCRRCDRCGSHERIRN